MNVNVSLIHFYAYYICFQSIYSGKVILIVNVALPHNGNLIWHKDFEHKYLDNVKLRKGWNA
jgi:hypothetical protein